MNRALQRAPRRPKPYVRAEPNPVPVENEGRTTIVWDTGDGSEGVVALVEREAGRDRLVGMTAGSAGAYEIDWIAPEKRSRFRLYRRADWDAREVRPPISIAETVVARQRRWPTEVIADLAFVGVIVGWITAVITLALGLALALRRSRLKG